MEYLNKLVIAFSYLFSNLIFQITDARHRNHQKVVVYMATFLKFIQFHLLQWIFVKECHLSLWSFIKWQRNDSHADFMIYLISSAILVPPKSRNMGWCFNFTWCPFINASVTTDWLFQTLCFDWRIWYSYKGQVTAQVHQSDTVGSHRIQSDPIRIYRNS
jgi:hypothetical protein